MALVDPAAPPPRGPSEVPAGPPLGTQTVLVGIDVGGSKTEAIATDASGTERARVRLRTRFGPAGVLASIAEAAAAVAAGAHLGALGIGVPGLVDPVAGVVRNALNLGVDELALRREVEAALGVPVRVENDVKAAALGAAHPGALLPAPPGAEAPAAPDLAYLNLGTGVAAGVVLGGRLVRGARGVAGEVGHISVDPAGPVCRCGQRGCVEALAGGGAIAARWRAGAAYPVRDVFDAADAGDARALEIRRGLVEGVAGAVTILALSTDVERIVLGGGLTALGDRLLEPVRADLRRRGEASAFIDSLDLPTRLELVPPGSPVAARGAALLAAQAIGTPEQTPERKVAAWPR